MKIKLILPAGTSITPSSNFATDVVVEATIPDDTDLIVEALKRNPRVYAVV